MTDKYRRRMRMPDVDEATPEDLARFEEGLRERQEQRDADQEQQRDTDA